MIEIHNYSDFKHAMESVNKAKKGEKVIWHNNQYLLNINREEMAALSSILNVMVCACSVSQTYLMRFCEMLSATETEQGRAKYGLREEFAKNGTVRAMNNCLRGLVKEYDSKFAQFAKGNYTALADTCNMVDRGEELIEPLLLALERLMLYKLTRKTLSTPYDPVLLKQLIVTFVMLSICNSVYQSATSNNNFPYIKSCPDFNIFRMNRAFDQLNRMLHHLDFHDDKGRELKTSINALVQAKDADNVISDIITLMLSLEFQKETILTNEPDREFGDDIEHQSLFSQLDKDTLTIAEFHDKYDKMFRYVS